MKPTLEEILIELTAERQQEVLLTAARENEENGNDREIGLLQTFFYRAFSLLSDEQRRECMQRIVAYDPQIRREVAAALIDLKVQ